MKPIQFSVVIPLYNKSESIVSTLDKVAKQRLQPTEIIVVNDGSSDDSVTKVEALNWPNIRIINQSNQGVSAARNRGVAEAENDYVAFLDADDQWSPHFLEEMQQLILRFPSKGLYACRYQITCGENDYQDAKIRLTSQHPDGYLMHNYLNIASKGALPFMVSGCVVHKGFYHASGGFPVGEWMGEDQSFFIQAALANTIVYTPKILLFYHTDSSNRASDKLPPTQMCPFAERLLAQINTRTWPQQRIADAERYCAAHLCDLAKRHVLARSPKAAQSLLAHPLSKRKPLHRFVWKTLATTPWLVNTMQCVAKR